MRFKRLNGFTLAEMMVTLALTSILITCCYMGFSHLQLLLGQYDRQSRFVTRLSELRNRCNLLITGPGIVLMESDAHLIFRADTIDRQLVFDKERILLMHNHQTDTFQLSGLNLSYGFEPIGNVRWQNQLISSFEFDLQFQQQQFHLAFYKNYDAVTKLNLENQP